MSTAPYTPVVTAGGWIAVSGQVPLRDGAFLHDKPFAEQVDGVLANVVDRLAEAGATLADVVKANIYLVDMEDYTVLNERWVATFAEPRPARTCVAVAALPFDCRVEVEVWALAPDA